MTPSILRAVAVTLAVAAFFDPTVTISGRARSRIAVIGENIAAVAPIRARLASDLRRDFDVVAHPDSTLGETVVVGDRYVPVPAEARISTVTLQPPPPPNLRFAAIEAPRATPAGTAIRIVADIDSVGLTGGATVVTARIGGVESARASHTWRADRERWRATFDAVPIGDPPYIVRLEATGSPRAAADVLVDRRTSALQVVVYEGRPSFATTFVRRALEGDDRFHVESASAISRGVQVSSGPAVGESTGRVRLQSNSIDRFDCIIVGGLDALTRTDVDALDRFARVRGGSIALVPDRMPVGPLLGALLPSGAMREVLLDKPAALAMAASLPALDASELLTLAARQVTDEVLATSAGPVIVVSPHGDGRVLFSGALDAWRFRGGESPSFERFWRAAIAGLALAAPAAVDVRVSPVLAAPAEPIRIVVNVRRTAFDATGDPPPIAASVDGQEVVRLWPEAARGVFSGSFAAPERRGTHQIQVIAEAPQRIAGAATFVVQDAVARADEAGGPPLSALSASHHGINVTPADLPALEDHLRRTIAPATAPARAHPMRSGWWMVPFAGCLAGEWWLRRKLTSPDRLPRR